MYLVCGLAVAVRASVLVQKFDLVQCPRKLAGRMEAEGGC